MNIDFITYTPPRVNYDFITLWGEVLYLPKILRKTHKPPLFDFLNCWKVPRQDDHSVTLEAARLDTFGIPIEEMLETTAHEREENIEFTSEFIPCLYLNGMVNSKYLFLYFHSSGEDIKLARGFLDHLRNLFQTNVLAVEYPGYSLYRGSPNTQQIYEDAESIYDYMTKCIGFLPENIIVIGRSIGTSAALELANRKSIGALSLISPFSSLKAVAKQLAGSWTSYLIKEQTPNLEKIQKVKCPLYILHGKADKLISHQHSVALANKFKGSKRVNFPKEMTHSSFDYYTDFSEPLREFLLEHQFNFYSQQADGPEIPPQLYKNPVQMYKQQSAK